MFAQGDDIDTQLVGEHRLVHDLPDRGGVRQEAAGVVLGHVAEGVETKLQIRHFHPPPVVDASIITRYG
jgi:hypothetical protein